MKDNEEKIWMKFMRKRWKAFAMCVATVIAAIIGIILVFLWFVGHAQSTGLVPALLGSWSMGYFITFLLHLIFWELVLVGIPVIVVIAAIYHLWWKKLPSDERKEYKRKKLFGKRTRKTDAGEGFSFLIFIVFVIKIWLDGNWNMSFENWTFDYLVYSWLTALVWILIIIGIPILIGALWWLNKEMKKKPQSQ